MLRFTFFFSLLLAFQVQAQYQPTKILESGDVVTVEYSSQLGKVYNHQMEAKETVYSLAKTFGQRIGDLATANPQVDLNNTKVGQTIQVPFLSSVLVKHSRDLIPGKTYVPVFYKVQPKDNFFRIARVYFNQTIENLLDINQLETFDLSVGQKIQVGWMNVNSKSLPGPVVASQPVVKQEVINTTFKAQPASEKPIAKVESPEVSEDVKPSKSKKREKTKKSNKFLSKLKKSLRIKSKKKDIKEVVQLSEQLEQRPDFQEPEERKKVLEAKKVETPVPAFRQPVAKEEKAVMVKPANEENKEITRVEPKVEITATAPVEAAPEIIFKSEKGIAIWNQTSSDSKNMFALHPTAKVGSFIEITNPMMGKTVQAKIIGNIPPRTYTDDVSLVISPRVAKMLGVVDRRFMVKIKYREN